MNCRRDRCPVLGDSTRLGLLANIDIVNQRPDRIGNGGQAAINPLHRIGEPGTVDAPSRLQRKRIANPSCEFFVVSATTPLFTLARFVQKPLMLSDDAMQLFDPVTGSSDRSNNGNVPW
jgi:hypothetical protein